LTSSSGSYQASWTLSGASGGAGSAILAFTTTTTSPADTTPPTTTIACNGGSCGSAFIAAVSVSLSATDNVGGSGVKATYYTTDGSDPTISPTAFTYSGPFSVAATTTVRYASVDNAGNIEAPNSQTITITISGGGVGLVQQAMASAASASALSVPLASASTAGDGLVAAVALKAGSSASVAAVQDSSGGSWTLGAVGYLTGKNSRVELWYRLGAPSVSSVTVTLSRAKAVSAEVSEWRGLAALDRAAGGSSSATASSAATPAITTSGSSDLVVGAINYPSSVTSSLDPGSFTGLPDFGYSTTVHGRSAYALTSSSGSYQASWTLSGASGGAGSAILAFTAALP
jgi:hypothetical protein